MHSSCWRKLRVVFPASWCRACSPMEREIRFAIARLKNKLGNRSNASAEVEFDATHGWLIGDEGEGIARIVEMVNSTRMDCAIGSAALMRAALAASDPSCRLPRNLRRAFDRASAHAERARGPRARIGGRDRALHARRSRDRRIAGRSAGSSAQANRDGVGQILRLQASAGGSRRGAGMPGRKRLRRRIDHAAALSRGSLELDLGRIG